MESKFEILVGDYHLAIGRPWVILTGYEEGDWAVTEWFYFLEEGTIRTKKGCRIRALKGLDLTQSFEEFWKAETQPNVENAIFFNEIYPRIKDKKDYHLLDRNVTLKKTDQKSLFHITSSDNSVAGWIKLQTRCGKLRDYVNVLSQIKIEIFPME